MNLKQYMFSFEEGGWNIVWAKTIRGARRAAVEQYADSPNLTVILSSVHRTSDEGLERAMSTFY